MGIFRHKKQLRSNLSPEELAKTQVLNLSDVERVANYEKAVSKKPAIIVGTLGLFSIALGLLYNPVYDMINKKVEEPVKQRVEEKIIPKEVAENITCTLNMPNNADGTDYSVVVNLKYKENVLQGYVRTYTKSPNEAHPEAQEAVTKSMNDYKALEANPMEPGYILKTNALGNGFTVVTTVDFDKLDLTKLNPVFGNNPYTKVEHNKNTPKESAIKYYKDLKYTCN